MKLEVNINFRAFLLITFAGVLIAFAIGVNAYGGTTPAIMGHSEGELDLSGADLSGADLTGNPIVDSDSDGVHDNPPGCTYEDGTIVTMSSFGFTSTDFSSRSMPTTYTGELVYEDSYQATKYCFYKYQSVYGVPVGGYNNIDNKYWKYFDTTCDTGYTDTIPAKAPLGGNFCRYTLGSTSADQLITRCYNPERWTC